MSTTPTNAHNQSNPSDAEKAAKGDLQGEGNYEAARHYREGQEAFAADPETVRRKAREAEQALDGKQGEELEAARKRAANGDTSS